MERPDRGGLAVGSAPTLTADHVTTRKTHTHEHTHTLNRHQWHTDCVWTHRQVPEEVFPGAKRGISESLGNKESWPINSMSTFASHPCTQTSFTALLNPEVAA